MTIEKTPSEYIIRLPLTISITEVQDFLNYLRYTELTSQFEATQANVDELVAETKKAWREKRQTENK